MHDAGRCFLIGTEVRLTLARDQPEFGKLRMRRLQPKASAAGNAGDPGLDEVAAT